LRFTDSYHNNQGVTMQQVFVEESQIGKEYVTITGSDVNHLKNVLRMKPGERLRVSTGTGKNLLCEISEMTDAFVQADIVKEQVEDTELPAKIFLFQALPKGDRMETVIQKAVELGVYEIIPVEMQYCVVRIEEKRAENKVKRWQAIAESAAKQSKRSKVPTVHSVMKMEDAISYAKECDVRIVPYENELGMEGTKKALQLVKEDCSISVMIGPEGGFSDAEIEALRPDFSIISLGKRILRTDTAAIATMAMLMLKLEEKAM
jgi:16S rRNA (uracil1498-N3)-methyltransferase